MIVGKNDKTVFEFNAIGTEGRDGNAISIANKNTVMRNFTIVFTPKYSGQASYQNAIFNGMLYDVDGGRVENVFFRIVGSNKATWKYALGIDVVNCTFYHDLRMVNTNYRPNIEKFKDIATNVGIEGTNTNVVIEDFGTVDMLLENLIQKSKENLAFQKNQVGVFYGEHAWK